MGLHHNYSVNFNINPPPPASSSVSISFSSHFLSQVGLNLQVVASTASADLQNPTFDKKMAASEIVMAHFDTGASKTSISIELAKRLKLIPIGSYKSFTAAGPTISQSFAIDLLFPFANLMPFINLSIGSCNLTGQNFDVLLGRDVMSRWNIVWNGPTSTVFIND
ncbi:MAG: retroviral-like aspartic protease family protein [Fibromonadales bacterium]|nr:retroviral-like aspartic protease family protein [Fibromonadales bacterium]